MIDKKYGFVKIKKKHHDYHDEDYAKQKHTKRRQKKIKYSDEFR